MLTEPTAAPAEKPLALSGEDEDIMSATNKQYAWIVNPPPLLDPARFLFQWLAVSLADIPLLVYQGQKLGNLRAK
jgi:hypothetical protein